MNTQRGFALLPLLFVFVAVALGTSVGYVLWQNAQESTSHTNNVNTVACTDEAKLCPDGSYVGRGGPDCAFVECPAVNGNSNS